jgi:hypothetical protein
MQHDKVQQQIALFIRRKGAHLPLTPPKLEKEIVSKRPYLLSSF